jgi:hypothetical protein
MKYLRMKVLMNNDRNYPGIGLGGPGSGFSFAPGLGFEGPRVGFGYPNHHYHYPYFYHHSLLPPTLPAPSPLLIVA